MVLFSLLEATLIQSEAFSLFFKCPLECRVGILAGSWSKRKRNRASGLASQRGDRARQPQRMPAAGLRGFAFPPTRSWCWGDHSGALRGSTSSCGCRSCRNTGRLRQPQTSKGSGHPGSFQGSRSCPAPAGMSCPQCSPESRS